MRPANLERLKCSIRNIRATFHNRNEIAEAFVPANVSSAAFIDGHRRLTDIARRRTFPVQPGTCVSSFAFYGVDLRGEGIMPRTDKSVTFLTGMIIAALYVILLVSFKQESYMRRDAERRSETAAVLSAVDDVSKRVCRSEQPICAALFLDPAERRNCAASIEAFRRVVTQPMVPFTLEGLRRAMRDDS